MNHPTGAESSVCSLCTAEAASKRCMLWVNLVSLSLVLCLGLSGNLIAQPFVRVNASLPSTFPERTSWADYDADGDMDLLTFDLVDDNTWEPRLYRNDGNGVFVRVGLPPAKSSYYGTSHFWADDDRDGRLDLLVSGSDEASHPVMRIFHGLPDGSFVDTQVRLPGEPVLWVDLDNDGALDILASARYGAGASWIWWNRGGTNYVRATPAALPTPNYNGAYIQSASAGDV